ncbi:carbohydrate ABC transporter permease [Paenibacillus sp. Marseille-P2973]|uniref:carbohydrate ABC transporter permease n=1 Tax=Paenibacillus sp. Marseille-P2973 TaxID=1871032 RepID=UPI001B39955E|nr:carbohydrate ABC transporter permease [Paenibacillus sp. Marseille-P2973]MBQ4899240.1 carbohydrate ABC transporter permease [Paenibacillus sp. Marseille-P2973]
MGSLLMKRKKSYAEFSISTVIVSIIIFLLGLMMVVPFLFMISAALKPNALIFSEPLKFLPDQIFWDNFKTIFHHEYFFKWYGNSIYIVVLTMITRFIVVTMAAYAFARLTFPLKNTIFFLLISTMMIPADTTVIARYMLYRSLHIYNSEWALIIPATFDVFFIFLLRQFFAGLPKEISEAAVVDGCSQFKIYYRIVLPLAVPALVTMLLFTFIWTWNDFVNPFIFISSIDKQVVTVGLEYFQEQAGTDYGLQMAGACIIVIIPILLFAFSQKYFVEGIASSSVKG